MENDLLGRERYSRHPRWRASGWMLGDPEEEANATFTVERHNDRWLLTDGDGTLRAMGDAERDLVAVQGGLRREPAPRGFEGHDGAALLRRMSPFTDEWLGSLTVLGSTEVEIAGRPGILVQLANDDGEVSLGVDAETGIWTSLRAEDLTITIDRLATMTSAIAEAQATITFSPLDLVPDVDLSHREPVSPALEPVLRMVQESSGFEVQVVSQEPQTAEFHFVLVDFGGAVVGQVLRRHALWDQSPMVFNGSQAWIRGGEYELHVDTSLSDRRAASLIMRDLQKVIPDVES